MVKSYVQDPSAMGRPISLATAVGLGWQRALRVVAPRCPYRVGDAVIADDPFNGRREGVVVTQEGATVGVRTPAGLFFYDHRQLRNLE